MQVIWKKKKKWTFPVIRHGESTVTPACFRCTWLHRRNEVNERNTFHRGKCHGSGLNIDEDKSDERKLSRRARCPWRGHCHGLACSEPLLLLTRCHQFPWEAGILRLRRGHHLRVPPRHPVPRRWLGVPQRLRCLASATKHPRGPPAAVLL